jgi:hypothetical protein
MFLLSIFTATKQKSNAEDFLLRSLVVEELKKLNEGIEMKVKGVKYFVQQARMILIILDTIAVEEFLKVQTNQYLAGCFICWHGKGYNYKLSIYPLKNSLRYTSLFATYWTIWKMLSPENYYKHGKQDECFEVLLHYNNPSKISINNITRNFPKKLRVLLMYVTKKSIESKQVVETQE